MSGHHQIPTYILGAGKSQYTQHAHNSLGKIDTENVFALATSFNDERHFVLITFPFFKIFLDFRLNICFLMIYDVLLLMLCTFFQGTFLEFVHVFKGLLFYSATFQGLFGCKRYKHFLLKGKSRVVAVPKVDTKILIIYIFKKYTYLSNFVPFHLQK